MCAKVLFYTALLFVGAASLEAAPKRQTYVDDGTQTALRELRDSMDDVRHEMTNHDAEIRVFEEKLNTYEVTIDSLRQQVTDSSRTSQQLTRDRTDQLEARFSQLESNLKGLIADMQRFKTHSQETADLIIKSKSKIDEMEQVLSMQSHHIDHLKGALGTLMEALQMNKSDDFSSKTYKVKTGDSLEKIARNQQTTIQAIKELNKLTNDKIIVGQTLKLP